MGFVRARLRVVSNSVSPDLLLNSSLASLASWRFNFELATHNYPTTKEIEALRFKKGFNLIFLMFVFAITAESVHSQGKTDDAFYNQPSELRLERATWRNFRDYRRQRPGEDFGIEGFYPIGWSKDGKFAYYLEPVDEACDCYFAKLFIVDLKTDNVLWSFDYNSEFIEGAKKEGRPFTLPTLWRANQKLFSEKLRAHDIEERRKFTLLSFPITYRGDRLTANLRTTEKPGLTKEERWYGTIGKATLQLNSRRYGTKTVLDYSYPQALPLYVGLIGYIKSPHEPRIAVVLLEILRGYEGPPHTARVRIVGADLKMDSNEIATEVIKRLPLDLLKGNRFKVAEPTGLEPATSDVTGRKPD